MKTLVGGFGHCFIPLSLDAGKNSSSNWQGIRSLVCRDTPNATLRNLAPEVKVKEIEHSAADLPSFHCTFGAISCFQNDLRIIHVVRGEL
jgi:hypothetical protein